MSHDHDIITNQSNKTILTSWVNAPSLVTHHMIMRQSVTWLIHEILDNDTKFSNNRAIATPQFAFLRGTLSPLESSVFWIPSLVCPALSLSASEVKLLVRANWIMKSKSRLRASSPDRAIYLTKNTACLGEILFRTEQVWLKLNWPPLLDCYCQKTDVLRSPVVLFPE